ncbi:MAG: hypothetical protein J0L52_01190 [Caulobacterales bacterium]|nr:hypothetical protein [Caulobacterales bacterium]
MTAFEFFFSIYGLLMGLSVAVLATGAARAFKHRRTVKVGWLTPLLAIFAALDIVSFWDAAWSNFQHLPYSYGLLVAGLIVATVYFTAASLIFPDVDDEPTSLDDHFWSHRRAVLSLLILANLLLIAAISWASMTHNNGAGIPWDYAVNMGLYLALIGTAAVTRRRWLVMGALGLHTVIYLILAVLTAAATPAPANDQGQITSPPEVRTS